MNITVRRYALLLFLMSSAISGTTLSAHPGKTDFRDGHRCLRNCEERNLYENEYHLHDKDRNAIPVEGLKKQPPGPKVEAVDPPVVVAGDVAPVPRVAGEGNRLQEAMSVSSKPVVDAGGVMAAEDNPAGLTEILLLSAALFLLLILALVRRRRGRS